jgi:hypothetical protein
MMTLSEAFRSVHYRHGGTSVQRLHILLTICCLLLTGSLLGQHRVLSGEIIDAETNHPLPSATLRITGSSKGTITNSEGQFRLTLPEGNYRIAASYLGYRSDTVTVDLTADRFCTIILYPNAIQLSGVTVTDEDPANEIIRRAIDSKQRWLSQLQTFEGKAFNRMQIRTDSSIAAIMEGYSTLYWKKDDSLREVITQQKKTGNLLATMQLSRVGEVMNFNDDRIRQNGYTFVGPTAPNAFDVYAYRLVSTRTMDDFDVYEIELIPRSAVIPLFRGTISIAERSFAVMGVDVQPNEAFTQMFINTRNARYTQSFRLFGGKFWLPVSYRFSGSYEITMAGLSFPAFGIDRDVVIYDYVLNTVIPDSIAHLAKVTVDSSAAKVDSVFWQTNDVLPLDLEQQTAYRTLDSTQTLEKRFAPKGAGAALLELNNGILGYPDIWFTRVEGWHLGISKHFEKVTDDLDLRGGVGYGLSDTQWKWDAGATVHFGTPVSSAAGVMPMQPVRRMFSVSFDLYDKQYYFPEPLLPGLFLNTFSALLLKDDVQDYYRAKGGTAMLHVAYSGTARISLALSSEHQLTLYQTTNFSLVQRDKKFAYQPGIIDGRMNAAKISFSHSSDALFGLAKQGYLVSASVEHSIPRFGGVFNYTAVKGKLRGKIATMLLDETVFPPMLGLQVAAGTSAGSVPPQRYYELYSRFETAAGYGTLRALPRRQFYGDRYVAFTIDHNFRRLLFAPLGIRRLMESGLELIVEANAARSWLSSNAVRTPLFPANDSGGWYYEASIGISNIADLFRFDVTRRFSAPGDWAFSLTISDFLIGLMSP